MATAEIVPPRAATRPDATNVARCPNRPMAREAPNVVSPAATNSRLKGSVASAGLGAMRAPTMPVRVRSTLEAATKKACATARCRTTRAGGAHAEQPALRRGRRRTRMVP